MRKLPDQKLDSACGQACDMFSPPARVETAKSPMVPGKEGCPLNVPADQVGGYGRARLPLGLSTELWLAKPFNLFQFGIIWHGTILIWVIFLLRRFLNDFDMSQQQTRWSWVYHVARLLQFLMPAKRSAWHMKATATRLLVTDRIILACQW